MRSGRPGGSFSASVGTGAWGRLFPRHTRSEGAGLVEDLALEQAAPGTGGVTIPGGV